MNRRFTRICRLGLLLASMVGASARAAEQGAAWPQLLGPEHNGVSQETNLLDAWPKQGLKVEWRVPGGVGMSGLAIDRGRVLTLEQREGKQWLAAHAVADGKRVWQAELAPAYENSMGDGPRATPTIAGDLVLTYTGEGILTASHFSDGRPAWSHDCVDELKGQPAEYGMACSPLVVDGQVIVHVGAPGATVAAYELASGKLAWKVGSDAAGYSSPTLLKLGGREQIVAFTGGSALGIAPKSGELLWRYPYETNYECNIAAPLAYKGQLFLSAGENHGSVLLAVTPEGGKFKLSEVWASQGTKSVLRSEWQTAVQLGDHFYGMDNVGGAGPITHLTCINAATGERAWQQARFGKGNLIAADGKLFISTMKGELVIARASPKAYEELGREVVLGSTRQAPALSDGRIYLRDDKEIVCIDVRR